MGNTDWQLWIIHQHEDHPHIHGEYLISVKSFIKLAGSPPHTWGIRLACRQNALHIGITPTYMGNTYIMNTLSGVQSGSPPHTWGIQIAKLGGHLVDRITPTYMGNTACQTFLTCTHKDHPHIHGEYGRQRSTPEPLGGSPPHTWGIQPADESGVPLPGITPTYMGNTWSPIHFQCQRQDHPHIHGEYSMQSIKRTIHSRITPTYMGNTSPNSLTTFVRKDHPHIHGEYCSAIDIAWCR